MSLLKEIQESLLQQGQEIGPILLKVRFLASRIGSQSLEEWVKFESEGYPENAELPDYRKVGIAYTANFQGPFGASISNAPIPSLLIKEHAGDRWNFYEIRHSIAGIESLVIDSNGNTTGAFHVDSSNLILMLQGNVYEGYSCVSVSGKIAKGSLVEIQNIVRSKLLELTIQLEKGAPSVVDIELSQKPQATSKDTEKVTHITNQIVHGNLTTISNSGTGAHFSLTISQGNAGDVAESLTNAGVARSDASEFARILATEPSGTKDEPFGTKAKEWFSKNIGKAADGTWKIGLAVASKVLTDAALKYYGLS